MGERIERVFASIAEGFGKAVTDIRSKLIDEGFWNRHVPEHSARDSLQALWGKDAYAREEPDFLDLFYQKNPELFEKPLDEMSYDDLDRLFDKYTEKFYPNHETHDREENLGPEIDR